MEMKIDDVPEGAEEEDMLGELLFDSDVDSADKVAIFWGAKRQLSRRFYSSTSSVFAEHSILSPDVGQVMFCLSVILQSQIYEDCSLSHLEQQQSFPDFEIIPLLPPEFGGDHDSISADVIERETLDNPWLRDGLVSGVVPPVDTILRFITMLQTETHVSIECSIFALIYLNRISSANSFAITHTNWRMVWTAVFILAQKFLEDKALKTSAFSTILSSITSSQLRAIESKAYSLMNCKTAVTSSLYARYYFELRQLFNEMADATGSSHWAVKSLTIRTAKRLEERSQRVIRLSCASARASPIGSHGRSDHAKRSSGGKAGTSLISDGKIGKLSSTGVSTPGKAFHRKESIPAHHTFEDVTRTDTSRYVLS